jgi:competence protein ComEC
MTLDIKDWYVLNILRGLFMISEIGRYNPLVILFVSLCSGILLWQKDIPALIFSLIILFFLLSRSRIIHAAIGIIIGVVSIWLAPSWVDLEEGRHTIDGVVFSSEYGEGTYRMILTNVIVDGKKVSGHAQLSVYQDVVCLAPGSLVSAVARIRTQTGFGNFDEFDYKQFLLSKGIVIKGVVKSPDDFTIKRYVKPCGLKYAVNTSLSGLGSPEAEVLKAMLTGDTSGITDSIQDCFNSLGISHLIAISGLNMAIIMIIGYTVIFSLLRIIPPVGLRLDAPLLAQVGAVIAVVIYTLFVGPNIPTLRAAIMACCVILSFFLNRKPHVLESLSIAGIIILILWPYSLYSASFLLTFAAVLGIIGTIQKGAAMPQWAHLITIPIIVAVFTMPIIIYLFGFISWTGILVNIIIVPFFSLAIMPLGIAGLLVFPFSLPFASYLFSLANDAIGLLMLMGKSLGSLIAVPKPPIYWVYSCYGGLIIAFFAAKTFWRTLSLVALCLAIVSIPIIQHRISMQRPLCFDFISVGQGDSILITKGPHAVLIDAGPAQTGFDMGRHVVAPHLLSRGITALDLIIVTHMHPDHAGGIPYMLGRFPVKEVWTNSPQIDNPTFQEIVRITNEKSIPTKNVCLGDNLHLGSLAIDVLGPLAAFDAQKGKLDINMQSVVVLVDDGSMKGLFMGDADMFGELVVAHLQKNINADVLKASHHGGERSCLDPFLDEVRPTIAVISCGLNNVYGDPFPESLMRLNKRGIKTYRTDQHGEIMITSLSPGFNVKSGHPPADNH